MAISTIGTDALAASAVTSTKLASGVPSRSQLPAGTVLQVVNATYSTQTTTTSTSYVTTGLTATITPTSSTSKIFVIVSSMGRCTTTNAATQFTIYRNNTTNIGGADGLSVVYESTGNLWASVSMSLLDSPSTTNATTYTVYFMAGGSGTAYSGWSSTSPQVITLMEIAA